MTGHLHLKLALCLVATLAGPPAAAQTEGEAGAALDRIERLDGPEPYKVWIQPGPLPFTRPEPIRNPFAGDEAAIEDGKRLYGWFNCGGCHGGEGGGGYGPSLRDPRWIYGEDPASLFRSIYDGRPKGMPTWRGRIPDDEIWKIVAYLQSISGSAGMSITSTGVDQ